MAKKSHVHDHNGWENCSDYPNCTGCHCHNQDERHTDCCKPSKLSKPKVSLKTAQAGLQPYPPSGIKNPAVTPNAVNLNEEEPAPVHNDLPPVWDLVIQDMKERNEAGIKIYETPLQPFNGRDGLVDLYQELLDACVYIRQLLEEKRLLENIFGRAERLGYDASTIQELLVLLTLLEKNGKEA